MMNMKKEYKKPTSRWVEMEDKENLICESPNTEMEYGGLGGEGAHGEAKFRRFGMSQYYDFDEEYYDGDE